MAKTVIKFTAVPYEVNGYKGLRPQLEAQNAVSDLDFCREVVTEKRLAMSPEELLHAVEMLGEVGPAKVAADGRPRAITKLLKYNRFSRGKLDSPTSPWNPTCRAYVKPQLLSEVMKEIDATFVNVNSGIGVRLNYVAWLGAKSVINVVKIGKDFAAYGNHMEWLEGDEASLIVGEEAYPLVCTESDVAHAVFTWPEGLAPEEGTQAEFVMKSRGGVAEGEVYTSKKTVTILAADPGPDKEITKIVGGPTGTPDDVIRSAYPIDIYGLGLEVGADGDVTADATYQGEPVHYTWKLSKVPVNTPEHLKLDYMGIDGTANFIADNNSEVTFTVNGVSRKAIFNPS